MNSVLVAGGTSGIGLALASYFKSKGDEVYVIGRSPIDPSYHLEQIIMDLRYLDESLLPDNIDKLYITCGVGYLGEFINQGYAEIDSMIDVNFKAPAKIINHYIKNDNLKECVVITSIAAHLPSPLFATYGATKSALSAMISNVNYELAHNKKDLRIIEVAPGAIKNTGFDGRSQTNLDELMPFINNIMNRIDSGNDQLIIPNMEVYGHVMQRAKSDPVRFAEDSIKHKSGRPTRKITVGYMTGCFDLFHVGHLNILKRAKERCDYLVVGLHKDGSHKGKRLAVSYEERRRILESCKYVDKVIMSSKEDTDPYFNGECKFDILFVGSDYKGSEKFKKYEEQAKNEYFRIEYLPYTESTSSTMIRNFISK